METKTNKLIQESKKIMGEDTDTFIIVYDNEKFSAAMSGTFSNIAKAVFYSMHHPDSPLGIDIYRIIKLSVLNIISNDSPYSADLLKSINSILSDRE